MYTSPISSRMKRARTAEESPSFSNPTASHVPSSVSVASNTDSNIDDRSISRDAISSIVSSCFATPFIGHSHTKISHSDIENTRLKSELARSKLRCTVLQVELEAEREKHKARLQALEVRIDELVKERRVLLESDLELKLELEKNSGKVELEESKLVSLLEAKNAEVKSLQDAVESYRLNSKQLEHEKTGLMKEIGRLQSSRVHTTVDVGNSVRDTLQEQVELLQRQLDNSHPEAKTQELEDAAQRLLVLSTENAQFKAENDYLKKLNSKRLLMEEQMRTFERRMKEQEDLKRVNEDLLAKVASLSTCLSAEQVEDMTDELRQRVRDTEAKCEQLKAELIELRSSCDHLKSERTRLKSDMTGLNAQIDQLQDEIALLKKEREIYIKEIDMLREQLKTNKI